MMNFRVLKTNIINTLGAAEAGRFQTIGYQRERTAAGESLNNLRMATVYYYKGDFPVSNSGRMGPLQHDVTYNINLRVSEAGSGDIALLNDPASTPVQRAAALQAFNEAALLADNSFDELAEIVFQILMDNRNYDFGMDKGTIADRWISGIQKDDPLSEGEYVVITGSMPLMCRTVENIEGDVGTPADTFDTTLVVSDDEHTKAGVKVVNTT